MSSSDPNAVDPSATADADALASEEVTTERMATGGEAVARLSDGRVVFVRGAVPDERVTVELTESRKKFARGRVAEVLEPGPTRTPVVCDHAISGQCGGCDWLYVAPDRQREFKTGIVREQLTRLGGIDNPKVEHHPERTGRRVTARLAVTHSRAGYRARRTSDRFIAVSCQALHPSLEELVVDGRYGGIDEVTLRLGAGTDQRMAVLRRAKGGATEGWDDVELPGDVQLVDAAKPADATYETEIGGRRWRVSAQAFFQGSDRGAEALVSSVAERIAPTDGPLLDLYAGGGLLGGSAAQDRMHTAVESDAIAVKDAKYNLGRGVRVINERVERWTPDQSFGAVIADPARSGLGAAGVSVVDQTDAPMLVLVSCDPAALGRDTGLLLADGWRHDGSVVIDMFPDTSRIEAVTAFIR